MGKILHLSIFVLFKESANLTADRLAWDREIHRQLTEEREHHEAYRVRALQQYEEDLHAWKEMHSESKETKCFIYSFTHNYLVLFNYYCHHRFAGMFYALTAFNLVCLCFVSPKEPSRYQLLQD